MTIKGSCHSELSPKKKKDREGCNIQRTRTKITARLKRSNDMDETFSDYSASYTS